MPSTFTWLPKRRRNEAVVCLDDGDESKGKKSFLSKPRRRVRRSLLAVFGGGASHTQATGATERISSSPSPKEGIFQRGEGQPRPTLFPNRRHPSPYDSPSPHARFFATSYDLTRPCPSSTSLAIHSSVDLSPRHRTSVAFVHPQRWQAFAETSEDLFDDEDPYQFEENPAQTHRGDFRSRAKLTCQSVLSLVEKTGISLSRNLRAEGMKSEVWASSPASAEMTSPPPVPARSRLRTTPTPRLISSPIFQESSSFANNLSTDELSPQAAAPTRGISHRQSSLFREPAGVPSPRTPPYLTSPSMPCLARSPSSFPTPPSTQDSPSKGRRSSKLVERDPYKIRDGLEKKRSSSGVYTPATFPGPCGPHPPQSPSLVYTSPNLAHQPRGDSPNQRISPSSSVRSSSSEQSDSTAPPGTPINPTGRFGKSITTQAKRLSTMAGLGKGRKDLERDSYFSSNTTVLVDSSRSPSGQSSWSHSGQLYHDSPSGYFYSPSPGLGLGIEEELQMHSVPMKSKTSQSGATAMGLESEAEIKKARAPVRGRRKPVPKYEVDEIVEQVKALEV